MPTCLLHLLRNDGVLCASVDYLMDEVSDKCGLLLPGQEFLKGIYSQRVPDMEALTSELAHQTRHPPPGESSPAETPEIVVHEGSATSARTGIFLSVILSFSK